MADPIKKRELFKTFLTYISADRDSAREVEAVLAKRDDVELTTEEIHDGDNRQAEFAEQVRTCDIFVVLLSPGSIGNAVMLGELGAAWGTCKAIVPVNTQRDVKLPVSLQGLITFELQEVLVDENWDRILAAFEGVREGRVFNFLTGHPLRSSA